ncbi:hypothetical protein E4U53_001174, partial [Claviceps sorghi]
LCAMHDEANIHFRAVSNLRALIGSAEHGISTPATMTIVIPPRAFCQPILRTYTDMQMFGTTR